MTRPGFIQPPTPGQSWRSVVPWPLAAILAGCVLLWTALGWAIALVAS